MFWNDIRETKELIKRLAEGLIYVNERLEQITFTQAQEAQVAGKTMDKFEDYMKNVDKLNSMINEFKGCVSMARGAIAEGKELQKEVEGIKDLAAISQQIYKSMISFIKASENLEQRSHFKLDAIYHAVCDKEEKTFKKEKKKKT